MDRALKKKSISSMKWTSINTIFNSIVTPLFYALLAILLTPKEFAYIAVITLVFRLTPILAKFGLEESYIQKTEVSDKQSSTLINITIMLSLIISCLLFFVSPLIEIYYNFESLSFYIRLLIIAILCVGVESIFKASLEKNFFFKQRTLILITSISLRISITIILMYFNYGVVSFVIGINVSTIFSLIAFIITSNQLVELRVYLWFDLKSIHDFLKFGYPITGRKLLVTFSQRFDEIIIGAFFSPETFGIYFFGKNLITQLRTAIVKSFSTVLLPLYSQIKHSTTSLKNTYFSITNFTAIIGFPVLIGISITADVFVPLIFGERWIDSVLVIQVLSVSIMLPIITDNNATSLLYSVGSSLKILIIEIVTSLFYISSLWWFLANGGSIITTLIAYSLFLTANSIALQYFVNKEIGSNLKLFLTNFKSVFISLTLMIIIVYFSKLYIFSSFNLIWQLLAIIAIGTVCYLVAELFIDRSVRRLLKLTLYKG